MGIAARVASKLRGYYDQIRARDARQLAAGGTGTSALGSGFDLLSAYGYDALTQYLQLDHGLLERFADYEEMDDYPRIGTALDIYADDSTQTDHQSGRSVWVTSPDRRVQTLLDDLLHRTLGVEDERWELSRTLCIAKGSRVWMNGAVLPIEAVLAGQTVSAWRPEGPVAARVEAAFPTGVRPVVRLRTKHRALTLTANHPVLVEEKPGACRWVEVKDLVCGRYPSGGLLDTTSRLVVATRMPPGAERRWTDLVAPEVLVPPTGRGTPHALILPETVEPWFCCLFGFLLGDGYLASSETTHSLVYSRGVHPEINDRYDALLARLGLPVSVSEARRTTAVHSRALESLLRALGWVDGAHAKRIPAWIYGLPEAHREAFLWGFWDADGWETRNASRRAGAQTAYHFELCNEALLLDLKALIDGLGYKSGNVRTRAARVGQVIAGRTIKAARPSYLLTFSRDRFEHPFVSERLLAIEPRGMCKVYDLTIAEVSNFTAEGVVVHNCKYGNDYEEAIVTEQGVVGYNFLPPPTVRRIEGPRGELFGFIQDFRGKVGYTLQEFDQLLQQRDQRPLVRPVGPSGVSHFDPATEMEYQTALEDWEVIHFRLRGKHRRSVYGHSVLEAARFIYRRLMLLEDAALIFRLQRAPEKLAFYVNVGNIPPAEAMAQVRRVRDGHRKKKYVNPSTGRVDMKMDPFSQDEDYWIPSMDGKDSTRIETVTSPTWQTMDDIGYFLDQLYGAMKIPKAYQGGDEGVVHNVLSSQDVRFARTILRVQQELRGGFRKTCDLHLAALGIPPDRVEYEIHMTVPSAIFELAQLEARNARADLAGRMKEFVSMPWILREVFGLSDQDIQRVFREQEEDQMRAARVQGRAQALMGGPPGGAPGGAPGAPGGAPEAPMPGMPMGPQGPGGRPALHALRGGRFDLDRAMNSSRGRGDEATLRRLLKENGSLREHLLEVRDLCREVATFQRGRRRAG